MNQMLFKFLFYLVWVLIDAIFTTESLNSTFFNAGNTKSY